MKTEQINNEKEGYFIVSDEGKEAGRMTYIWDGTENLTIEHTEVNPEFGGKGIGKKLLMELVEFAREKNIKVKTHCSFAKSMFDKIEDIRDVLQK